MIQVNNLLLVIFSCRDRANSNYIDKYNLQTEQSEAVISVDGYSPRKNAYGWGVYSGIDLAVDEQGLWVLYGGLGNNKRLNAGKIDVTRNKITHTYDLNTGTYNTFSKNPLSNKPLQTLK